MAVDGGARSKVEDTFVSQHASLGQNIFGISGPTTIYTVPARKVAEVTIQCVISTATNAAASTLFLQWSGNDVVGWNNVAATAAGTWILQNIVFSSLAAGDTIASRVNPGGGTGVIAIHLFIQERFVE